MIRGTSLAILALLALVVLATGSVFAGPRQAMDDATLSSLSLSDVTLTPSFASGTLTYTGAAANTVTETTVTATPTNPIAPVVIEYQVGQSFLVAVGGVVPLTVGGNNIFVKVTAEDGTTTASYQINVTRLLYIATRSFDPSTVAPGGTVAVTITYGFYGRLGGQTLETLPAGFSWIFVSIDDLPGGITAVLDPNNNQILDIIMLGQVDSFTYEVTVDDTVTPGVHTFSGTIKDDDRDIHITLGETEVTVAIPPGVTVSPTDLAVGEGSTDTYTVVLDAQPSDAVTVTIVDPTDNTDVTAEPASLTFSTTDWATAQTVTVSAAEDDDAAQDTATVTHTVSGGDYAAITAQDVAVTVTDNDTPGVTVAPTSLTVGEGDMGTYTVKLNTLPTGNVMVAISSNNTDVTVSPSPLTFTVDNWNSTQTVTVSAGQDADAANDMATLTHNPSGADYDSVSNADLAVTVTDDETRGVTVTPTSLTVTEGGMNTYTVVLDTQPTATVTVTIVDPADNADVTADPASLTFSTSNWATAQTVTVSAAEDDDSTEDTATVTHTVAGGDYDSFAASSVAVTVTDDDTPGVTFAPTSLTVGEGGTGTYTVVLDTLPTGDVEVAISSNNTDVTVSSSPLTFTTSNWNSAQTVTVSAGQDADAANDMATLTHNPSGADYGSVGDADLTVTVTDDETAGVTVTPTSLAVNEGGTNTYTVVLDTQPTATVTVTIVDPTDNTDVTTNIASLTFSTSNWATAQTVTVSAAEDDDSLQDTATVTHTVSGGDYGAVTAQDVAVTVTDNDTPGVAVTPMSLTVGEGSTDTYTVVLNTLPTGDVMVAISSNNTDVTVSSSPLTFTTTTWSTEQTVTVSAGQDDDAANDMATLTHVASGADYGSVDNAILTVTVTDNDTRGVTVTPTSLTVNEGGMNTYTVVLDTQPTATVTVTIVDPTDNADVTANPASLTFSTSDWATAQTVTVSAAEDDDPTEDTATVTHTVAGGDYTSFAASSVAVTVTDNDTPGVTVTPMSLTVGEGGTGRYTVRLTTLPTGNVMVAISSNNTDVTASSSTLTFTTTNWNSAQTVTVSAGQDDDATNDMATLTHNPSGADYDSVSDASLTVTVTDNDTRGVTVTPTSLTVNEGGTNTYTVVLDTQPTGTVTVTIVDPTDNTDVTANPTSLTFSTSDWATAQTVTVSAAEDGDPLEDTATVTHTVSGGDYAAITAQDVAVTVTDNDTPGVTVAPTSLTVGEGDMGTYTVKLNTLPTGNVLVAISSNNTDVTVSSSSLTFTAGNWNSTQTVTVTAGQDADAADDKATLTHNPSGADYGSVSNASLTVTVTDDETAGVTVTPTSLTLTEGGTNTYTVVLDTQPTATVTVTIVDPTDNADVTANPASLTFTTTNWDTAQTVTVSADEDDDSTQDTATVTHTVAGGDYDSFAASSVSVTVTDNDTPGVMVLPTSLTIDEGNTDTYTVELNTQPSGDVMVAISSNNTDVTVSSSPLTFTTTNWNSAQTVTVTAGQDADAADDKATLTHNPSGADYGSVSNAILMVTVTDDDTAGVTVTPTSLTVNEGGTNTYTIVLDTEPTDTVTVAISSNNTDVTVSASPLTVWDTAVTVTVSAAEDADSTHDTATVTHTFAGGDYNFVINVIVTVTDNDTPGVTVTPLSLTIGEGSTGTYAVVLNTQPSGNVMVAIRSNNTDVTVPSSTLTFTMTDWNTEQTVTVTAGQDADAANDMATLTHNPSGGGYNSVSSVSLMVTVTDDEMAGVTVTPTSLTVNEGGTNTYTVVLDTQPTATVTVTIVDPTDNADVTANPASLRFSTSNWATAQTVTVSADEDDDPTQDTATVTHTVAGGDYASFAASSVAVTVTDNDTPGVTVTPMSLTVGEGGTGRYTVRLNTLPTGNVLVAISSNNTDVTVPSSTLTFTTTTWSTEQTVTVTAGQDDDAANDMATLTHNPSGADYDSVSNASLTVTVTDNDTRGVTVSRTSLTISEGGSGMYTVKLNTQPSGDVTVTVNDPTDNSDVTAGPASLTFSTSDWNTEQTVTVSADEDADSTQDRATVTHTVSGGDYGSVTASGVSVTVTDNDTPGVTVTPPSLTVGEGGTGRYTVRLNTQPSGNVMVAISSNNTDVTVPQSSSTLTFTTTSWSTEQTVTVSAGQDADAANDMATLTHNPSGGGYGSVSNAILMVTVTDDDTAGLMLSTPTLGVDEGGQAAYTVKLQTQPTTTVTVTVSSDDTGAATVSGPTLRFSTSNWDTEQTVTVRGVNDGDSDDETVTVTNTASGGEYAGVTETVTVTVDDDDTRGITFTPAARTIREGATGTYDVKLNTAPTADVTVAISSDNADVTVNTSSLTFTTVNYARNQRVTVTAAQDADAADGTANLTHRPTGGDYSAGEAKDFMVTVTDDDTAGLVLSATTLGVDEAGQNTYTVKLQTQPTVTVTVTVSSDDTGAATATVSGSTLRFTASNWETEQTVTVEGVDDGDSANETVTVTNTASGGEYAGVTASVRVTVDDDDKPGITFTPASLTVGEAGVGTYGVRLNAAPTADVTVAISSSNPDVTVNKSSLTFTTVNYATNQRVDVTAAEDADAADDTANLRHRPSGGGYGSGQNKDLIVTVTDYDTARLMLSTTFLDVDEGGQNTYTVKLQTQPTTTVTVTVSSDDTDAATVSGPTLRFTTSNWDTEQTVTVRGVNDGDSDGETVTVTNTASGGEYAGVTETVTVTVDDDDTRGITFTPAARTIREGATGTYDVKLNTAPTADVVVEISSDNADVTVNKSSLTFTTANYATNQRVTVTAAQDADAADGTANLTHRPTGGDYSAGEAKDFMVTVTDDDTAGLVLSATTLGVDEAGQNTYTVKLQTEPTVTVTVTVSSDDTGAATATVSGSTLRFTTSNWETERTVTVEGVDDGDSANETVTVTNTASGGEYEGVTASVRVTVDDDDKPGITFTPASLTVGEAGVGTYGVRLNAAPTADVTVAISSSNPDVTVNKSSLTFTTVNYATNQRVDVTAAEDADAADDTANLRHRPSGGGYGSGQNKDLIVTVTDYDTARLELSVWFLDVDEGGQNTYTVKLQTQPTTTVTVTVSSGDTDAATVSGPTLRFTTSNWDTEQTVTVRGVNDGDSDGEFVTITNTASGGEYAGVTETVWLFVDDDDTRGITFTPAARTIREGATGTYDVKLNTAPTADVTVAISSDNPDVTVNTSSLTFTTVNYARNQRVTVTAAQDADAADGTANLTHRPTGGDYSAGEAKDFMVTVTDDDTAGLVLSATTLGVDEAGQNTYTVKLQTEPTVTVTVTVSSDDPGAATVIFYPLRFTASNWETEQTVIVEGVDDGDSANETVTVTNTASGGEYEGVTASVRVTVDDDDKPGITFTPASLTVGEAGVGTYGVRLNAAPTADVTVAISSSNPDVTVNKSSLTFTTVNYATNQRVDVTAAEDADAADDTANLRHRPSGGGYGSGQNKDLIVTVTDYDTARLMLSTTFLDVDEGGQAAYTVKLQTQPTTTVTVTVSSDDTDAATVSGPTLRFTTSNWDTEQTVTVRGVNDGDSDGETVTVTNTASGGEYAGVTETVTVTVDDDDTRGITFTPAARTIREGATGTYDVKLNTAPTADVTVAISSDNPDVTVNKSSLTFTTVNYATNQRVTVTAAQDADAADGTANLTHSPSGGDYSAGEAKDFMVTVTDDDTAGLMLSATTLGVDEAGQNTYTVKLQTQPTTTVTVTVSSDDTGAATVSGSTLRFTTSNWETERTVTVEGVDDGDSANETVTVTNTASGGEYEGVTASVRVTVDDDDKPGITFTPASLTVGEAGVGTYGVRLIAAPTADVTVAISSSNPDVTVNTSSLTFTTVNYATNQRVDVTAAEDADAADDTANLRHRPSGGGYGSGQNKDLIVTVTDYDTARLELSVTFLDVDEGGQNTYTVKLQTQPTTTVTVTVSSDDTDAATVSGPTLRFTTSNWDTEQTVTVRGVNDGDSDDETVTVTNTASGGEYAGVTETVTVTVDDDDTRGITFTPAARTIREGATGTYDVKLNTAPTADVTVAISSDNPDVTVNKSSLTFTTVNYARNQRVTVTAAQDADAADGTANLTHSPSGGDYSAGEAKDFMVTVTDDDTAGLMLSATTLGVDEAGQNTYTVKLQTEPTVTVTVTVSSDDPGAATVIFYPLRFTASNWETEQTVIVEGVDDGDSANETVTVTNTASGGEYEGVTASVRVTVDDDDKPGITFTPASLTVGEAGVGTYGVRLNAAPTADVTVAISSSNPDVTVNKSSLTFTTVNYATNQRVDVTAAEDADAADDTANLRHRPSGGGYGSGQNKDLIVTVTDYDTARLMLSTTFLDVDEGGQNTYTVKLQTQPTTTVTVTVSSDDTDAATVSGPTLRFTTSNWDTEQTVTVRGVNDGDSDGETVTVTNTASGGEYAGVTETVTVTVDDDDTRGITFTPAARTIREGATGTYDVKLNTAPTADVVVEISSDNPDVTVNTSSLTFTTVNYATNQRVTVTAGQDADAADGTANLTHRPSGGDYSAGEAKDFMVTVTDDDTAGLMLSATTLGVDEAGQNTYTVKLQTEPTVTVTVTVSSDDTGAATATVSGSTLRFTTSNWETERTVTVEGVDDGDSANETVTVTNTASGGEYAGVTASVTVTVDDDDKPGITFTPASLTVGEAGVGTYGVRLNAAPTADVTVAISSSNPDVTVNTSSLTFTTVNYATNQRVDVTAAEDADAADDTANLRHRPSGGGYGSGQNKDLIVTVTDYDTARLELSVWFLDVDEGGQNTYTVKLQTQPTTTVTVTVSSDDTDAATVSGPTLRFTTSNWDTEQTVTVRGVNDGDSDGEFVTITNTASGGEYAGVTETVWLFVDDDDTRGITFTPAARTIREGATGTYDVKLNTAPTADVTVAISSDNPDVTVNKSSLTFTTANYATNQRVTVTAAQDADAADGTANLTHSPSGGDYSAGEAKDFMVTVTDDDTAGLVLSATTLGVDEAGQNTYTVKLQTEPTVTVTVTVSSDDPGAATVIFYPLRFTASNWETEQTVIVEGVDDGDSANETVTVTNTASGGEYEGVTASVRVTVDDDDKPGITFTPASLTVGEAGVGTYGVRLNAAPTADVTVAISSSNPDVTVNTSSLTFTTVNYATNQRVDVTAAEDADAADDTANLRHRPSGGGYGSGQNKDLIVTVTDYDTARLMLSTTFLDVDEGGQAAYTVKLQTQPTTTVTVTVSSDDTDAATVSGPTLRFTTSNWDTEQTVTVRGVNDGDSDGETVTVTNTASGGEYAGVTETVTVTVDDDDTRGITFTPAARTIREGATGTYDVKLNTAPTADVTVAISSDNPDVTVNTSSLTFTTVNYARNQRVTVTAAQDADAADGTANLTHRPTGGDYSAGEAKDFMVTVTDDDTAGLMLSATTLGVDEAGQNTYTVKLQTQPTTTVTVTVSSDDTGAATATVSGSTLRFTTSNWETEQTVTVEGVDDGDSANETVTVTNTASGGEYEGVTASVRVTVDDDDKPGITFTPASLTVGEAGVGTYGVRLIAAPTADVTVAISSSNPDVTVNKSSLTFTTVNYATNQRVDVTAAEDADAADDTANLRHRPSGGGYGSGQNKDLIVTVTDYDTARLELSVTFLDVDEGGQNTYTVKLQTQPTTTVTVTVSSDDTDAATVSGPTLRFTTSNWDTEQTVTVRGVNDGDSDDETVTVTNTASGGEYAGVTETVTVTVDDDDTRGITFTPAARTIREGATGTYDVKLNTAPTADVTVAISSDNPDVTVNKSSLTFTTVNYARNQRVTVTAGQDADAADGTANLTHRPTGGDYSAGEAKDFMVTVTDDDTAGLVLSATTLGVDEAGQNTYTVKLQTEPTVTVTVTVSSDDTGAATATVSGSTLRFTASNWETEQTVTVEGVDDGDSANETVTVTNTASGGEYEGVTASVRVTVDDDDKPGITFTPASLTVGEAGVGTYGVRLNAAPTADVTVAISSSNPDVTVNTSSLTFTTVNYATNQRVDVTAAEDADAADDTANLRHRPSGGGYGSGQNKDLIVTVTDYDTARLELSVTFLDVDEGGQNTYTVKLQTQPTTTVTVTVSSDDTDAATVSGPTLRFTTSNWDTEQTVTVRGVNDGDSDDETVTVTNTASGGEYAGVTASVTVTVDDDDTRGITFTPAARTIREGATGTYDVKLNTAPTADVTVAISSDNPDVTVNKSSLTFTTVNYATNQRVTVTAAQDADAADGTANLTHSPSGGDYSAGEAKDFMVTVTDDDTAGLMLSATTLGVDEAGQNTYTVKLQTQPTVTVTVTVSSDDTGAATATVSGSTLRFTASNWETERTVTVEGVDDGDSANETVTVTNTASGGEYEGVTASVRVTVDDDDKPGITFTPASLTVGEAGVGTYGVRLNAAPTADVTVAISSSNPDVTVNTSSLTFTTVNYATNQRVDVTAAEDADAADDTANLRHRPSGGGYGSGQNKDLIVTVTDYDTARLELSVWFLDVDEGGQNTYTVKLQTQPTTTVTVTVSSDDTDAATVSGPTLRFTTSNWDTEQTVTVRGVNDGDSDGEFVTITNTASGGEYAGVTETVWLFVDDDDTRGITFTPAARTIREGATGTYDVKLNTAPTADVTVAISSDNPDVTVNTSSLTFTTANYARNQRVTVTAAQDADAADGTANLTHRPTGGDYSAGEAKDFMVTVTDDDTAGLVLSATTLGVDEAGQNTYTVKLQTEPTTTVTVTVSSDDPGAATSHGERLDPQVHRVELGDGADGHRRGRR